ncbi:hypothetical protein NE237_030034 [Protea cynaroides]|uniref:Uncharacterized protein n=1 Tax=Protea cynaroides TaxID=273540 RepID=A0A9Q0GWE3_9MAGN|nr:hypothetical protein NE237_030034 [Protea cynaroides]
MERSPQMLKDFLVDDLSSCSSNRFASLPRRACCTTVPNLVEMDSRARDSDNARKLLRRRFKAASKTISTFQKASELVINVIKHLPFSSIKARSQPQSRTKQRILPRSLSRRLRRSLWKKKDKVESYDIREIKVRVMIKDIIRWKSFRDLIEEKQQPLNFSSSPLHTSSIATAIAADADTTTITTTTTTTTTTTSISSSNSYRKSNSWSACDFTSEFLQSSGGSSEYLGENEGEKGKECSVEEKMPSNRARNAVCEQSMETTTNSVDPKGDTEEKEQFSPVSVLDFPEEEDDDDDGDTEAAASPFHQSLNNLERKKKKLMQKIRRFESLSKLEPVDLEKRIALSEKDESGESPFDMKLTNPFEGRKTGIVDRVLVDFLMEKIMRKRDDEIKSAVGDDGNGSDYKEVVKVAIDWMSGNHCGGLGLGLEYDREGYVKEMECGGRRWRKFEEEQEAVAMEVGTEIPKIENVNDEDDNIINGEDLEAAEAEDDLKPPSFKFHHIWPESNEIQFLQGLLVCSIDGLVFPHDLPIKGLAIGRTCEATKSL